MSTEMTISSNHVVVVGMLDTMMVRDRNAKRDKERGRPILIETTRKEGWEPTLRGIPTGSMSAGHGGLPRVSCGTRRSRRSASDR